MLCSLFVCFLWALLDNRKCRNLFKEEEEEETEATIKPKRQKSDFSINCILTGFSWSVWHFFLSSSSLSHSISVCNWCLVGVIVIEIPLSVIVVDLQNIHRVTKWLHDATMIGGGGDDDGGCMWVMVDDNARLFKYILSTMKIGQPITQPKVFHRKRSHVFFHFFFVLFCSFSFNKSNNNLN